jgi:hypothetical protein
MELPVNPLEPCSEVHVEGEETAARSAIDFERTRAKTGKFRPKVPSLS